MDVMARGSDCATAFDDSDPLIQSLDGRRDVARIM